MRQLFDDYGSTIIEIILGLGFAGLLYAIVKNIGFF